GGDAVKAGRGRRLEPAVASGTAALVAAAAAGAATRQPAATPDPGPVAGRASSRAPEEYLKRSGDNWFEVVRDPRNGSVRSRREVATPGAASVEGMRSRTGEAVSPSTQSPFLPYVTYATSSWPEAVAIGDVNGDARN